MTKRETAMRARLQGNENEPQEVTLLKWRAHQLAEPYLSEWTADFIHQHYDAIVATRVTSYCMPVDQSLADYVRVHWPQNGTPVPSPAVLMALAVAILGIIKGMADEEIAAGQSN